MFKLYIKCLLSTEVHSDFGNGVTKNYSNYNEKFRLAWSTTNNYHKWKERVSSSSLSEDNLPSHPSSESKFVMIQALSSMTNKLKKKHSPVPSYNENLDHSLRVTLSARNLVSSNEGDDKDQSKLHRGNSLKNLAQNQINSKPPPTGSLHKKSFKNYFEHLRMDKSHDSHASEDEFDNIHPKNRIQTLESKPTESKPFLSPTRSLNLRQWTISGDSPSSLPNSPKGEIDSGHETNPKQRPLTTKLSPTVMSDQDVFSTDKNNSPTALTNSSRPPPLRKRRTAFGDLTETLQPSFNLNQL
jgi:hypothetical protein